MKYYFYIIASFILCNLVVIKSYSKNIEFEAKPFVTEKSNIDEIKLGLLDLYKNSINTNLLLAQAEKADHFQSEIYAILNEKISTNKMITASISEKNLTGNFVKETTVRFKSLISQETNDSADMVVARIYEPTIKKTFCNYKYPTTIILHHILNEVGMIEDLSKVMAAGVLAQPAIFVVIHLPHYGDRRSGQHEFLSSNLSHFRKNMAQLILDVHLLKNYLETRENINTEKLSLSGLSLGAVMAITVGAFDQGFSSYGNLVGGSDMANILMNRVRTRPDSEVAVALKDTVLDENLIRNELASVDPMTWLHRYKNKKILLVSATRDDIVDFKNSVEPLALKLKSQNNHVIEKINDDEHSPTGSIFKKLKTVFLPLLNFVVDKSPTIEAVCPAANNQ